jgi:hypothetical protein
MLLQVFHVLMIVYIAKAMPPAEVPLKYLNSNSLQHKILYYTAMRSF